MWGRCGAARFFHSSSRTSDLISGALDEVLAEEVDEDDDELGPEEFHKGQDFAKGKRKNAKGSQWRYDSIIGLIRGTPLNVRFLTCGVGRLKLMDKGV